MPESKRRKRPAYTPPPPPTSARRRDPSPPWVGFTILGLFVLGIAWLIVFYVSGSGIPGQRAIGNWNILVGFGLIVAGFGMLTRWR